MGVRSFCALGTVVSVAVEGAAPDVAEAFVATLERRIGEYAASLSRWRDDSSLSRLRRGELVSDPVLEEVVELAGVLELVTEGAFDPHGPEGLDLDGVAKGWIVERAATEALRACEGAERVSVTAGGDVWLRGVHHVGVQHPREHDALCALIRASGAVATSGTSERGDHVRSPSGSLAALQATVCARHLWLADGLATAVLVAGESLARRLEAISGVGWLLVTRDGRMRCGGRIELVAPSDRCGGLG